MIIAIDGPAGAGKGTLARALAAHYGFAYLDTGSLYRAVGLKVLAAGGDPDEPDEAVAAARSLSPDDLQDPALRGEGAGHAASKVAAIPEVREVLISFQRNFAAHPPGEAGGAVIDGRDIGTVVCPDANRKLFVTASPEERARRRFRELEERGAEITIDKVLDDMRQRDARDVEREVSPLVAAQDAHLLDTTNLDIDSAFRAAVAIIDGT